jgi:RNA polymerase sigma-70 factor, ECF subfamily
LSAVASAPSLRPGPRPLPAEATRLLYERHSGRIFGYCLSLLGSREEAEDAVQTTFMNVQRGLERGVVPQFELAWLFKIARNVCYNRSESSSRRRRIESADDLDSLQEVLASPERGAAMGVSVAELTRALGAIPERQRRALLLREFQGMSYEEIAGELGVSVAAVETLLFRARRSLADQLEQAGIPRRRGAAASVVALFRWFFDGSAVPIKLAAVTAAVATTATLAVAPMLHSDPAGPVHVIPAVGTPPHTQAPARSRADVGRGKGRASGRSPHAVGVTSATATEQSESASGATSSAHDRGDVLAVQGQQSTAASSSSTSTPPTVTSPMTLPTGQDVTEVLPVTVPEVPLPAVEVPPVQVDTSQLSGVSELPKLP